MRGHKQVVYGLMVFVIATFSCCKLIKSNYMKLIILDNKAVSIGLKEQNTGFVLYWPHSLNTNNIGQ